MVAPATFIQSLTVKINNLEPKVASAESAWRAYVDASNTFERQYGPRPLTARQSTLGKAIAWLTPGMLTAQATAWLLFDRGWGQRNAPVYSALRTALRYYNEAVTQIDAVSGADLVQQNQIYTLRQRGEALKDRGLALLALWQECGASISDPETTNAGQAFMRVLTRVTPLARWESSSGALATGGGGGSATGASSDLPGVPGSQQGTPPWVVPVVGVILVAGVGYALWNYSKTH